MKKILPSLLAIVALVFTGCIQMEDTLTLNGDGSGTWKFKLTLGPQMVAMMSSGMNSDKDTMFDEKKFRAAVAKVKGARVVSYSSKETDGSLNIRGEIAFTSIVELYRSSAFEKQLNWEFKEVDGKLEATISKPMMGGGENSPQMDFNALKALMLGMKIDRTLVLPNQVISANGKEKAGKQARWIFEFTRTTTEKQLAEMNEVRPLARCSAAGVTFKLPLVLKSKAPLDLSEFSTDDATIKAKLDQVIIRPIRAQLMRTTKYDSKDNMIYGNAPLTLRTEISWPGELRPSGWSHLLIEEGSDNTGTILKLQRSRPEKVNEMRLSHGKENVADLTLNLSEPARNATTYSLKGALVLHVPGSIRSIAVPGIKDMVGKKLDLPGLEPFGLTLKKFSTANVVLAGDQPNDAIIDLKLVSPDLSVEQKRFHMSRMKFREEHRINAGFMNGGQNQLDNPTLIIIVAGDIEKYAVPFEFKDLKMP